MEFCPIAFTQWFPNFGERKSQMFRDYNSYQPQPGWPKDCWQPLDKQGVSEQRRGGQESGERLCTGGLFRNCKHDTLQGLTSRIGPLQ